MKYPGFFAYILFGSTFLACALATIGFAEASDLSIQATPTATPRQFCHTQYLVFVHNGVRGVYVRPTPSKNTTPLFVVNSTQNPQIAIGLENGWFQLCSISGQYMISDPELNIAVSVTPSATRPATTPTRLVTNTPSPIPSATQTRLATNAPTQAPSATATSTPDFDYISIDTDRDGFLEYTLRCETPCTFIITDKEPSGILQVSVTEVVTEGP